MWKIFALIGIALLLHIRKSSADGIDRRTKEKIVSGINEFKAAVDTIEKFFKNKDDYKVLFKRLTKLSGYLGVFGGIVSMVLVFLPQQDSAEMKFMKEKFSEVNMKLDRITSEIDTVKDMITLEVQRANYIEEASKIINGYQQLTGNYIEQVSNITCNTTRECLRERLKVSESYLDTFNVKRSLVYILKGSSQSTSVFGDSLLDMIQETYKCDIPKLERFASGVLKLAFKAQFVVLAYEKLAGSDTSITLAMKDWSNMVYELRAKLDDLTAFCYDNIESYISVDVENTKYQTDMPSNQAAVDSMKESLQLKYPWLHWTIVSYGAFGGDKHWGFNAGFINMPALKEARKRVIRITPQDKGTYLHQRENFVKLINKFAANSYIYSKEAKSIFNTLEAEWKRTDVWEYLSTFLVLRETVDFSNSVNESRNIDWYNGEVQLCHESEYRDNSGRKRKRYEWVKVRIIATFESSEQIAGVSCSKSCNNHGECFLQPFSSSDLCKCNAQYEGENCENFDDVDFASSVDEMLKVTAQIPKLTDVYYELLDMQDTIGISLSSISNTVAELGQKLKTKFNDLKEHITEEFKWANLITQYSQTMQLVTYYIDRFNHLNTSSENYDRESIDLAKSVLEPGSIRLWLLELDYLIKGRNDLSVVANNPLLFLLMDRHKDNGCSSEYKTALDNTWRQIMVLQNQAYIMWAHAKNILKQPSSDVKLKYNTKVEDQTELMQTSTCELVVSNSVNLQCEGGFYLYPKLSLTNTCEKDYYINGTSTTTCESNASECAPCSCNSEGSSSTECNDVSGQCYCIGSFYGKQCGNRDCKWTAFGSYGPCSKTCGYGGKQSRTRSYAISQRGNGKKCSGTNATSQSCFNECCSGMFHCTATNKCILGSKRCNYFDDCGDGEDEKNCEEQCSTYHTSWGYVRKGSPVYLDRHSVSCANNYALKMFQLQKRDNNDIRYEYVCCRLLNNIGELRNVKGSFTTDGGGKTEYLDRQYVYCDNDKKGPINFFRLNRNSDHDEWRYSSKCIIPNDEFRSKLVCYSYDNSMTRDGNVHTLTFQRVICNDRYFLTYFNLQRDSGHDNFYYRYRCCRIQTI